MSETSAAETMGLVTTDFRRQLQSPGTQSCNNLKSGRWAEGYTILRWRIYRSVISGLSSEQRARSNPNESIRQQF